MSDTLGLRIRLATTTEMQRANDSPAAMMNSTPTGHTCTHTCTSATLLDTVIIKCGCVELV